MARQDRLRRAATRLNVVTEYLVTHANEPPTEIPIFDHHDPVPHLTALHDEIRRLRGAIERARKLAEG
jgi:hypothetical protein